MIIEYDKKKKILKTLILFDVTSWGNVLIVNM